MPNTSFAVRVSVIRTTHEMNKKQIQIYKELSNMINDRRAENSTLHLLLGIGIIPSIHYRRHSKNRPKSMLTATNDRWLEHLKSNQVLD